MANIKAKQILRTHPAPKPVRWVERKMAEIRRKKWEHTPEYNKAANAAYDIIEKNRARLNKNAGENELNRVR